MIIKGRARSPDRGRLQSASKWLDRRDITQLSFLLLPAQLDLRPSPWTIVWPQLPPKSSLAVENSSQDLDHSHEGMVRSSGAAELHIMAAGRALW
jgi:hypothetical protein